MSEPLCAGHPRTGGAKTRTNGNFRHCFFFFFHLFGLRLTGIRTNGVFQVFAPDFFVCSGLGGSQANRVFKTLLCNQFVSEDAEMKATYFARTTSNVAIFRERLP